MFAGLCHYDSFSQLVTVWQAGGGVIRYVCDNLANSLLCLPNFPIYHSNDSQRSDLHLSLGMSGLFNWIGKAKGER